MGKSKRARHRQHEREYARPRVRLDDHEVQEVLDAATQARWADLEHLMEDCNDGGPEDENFLEQHIIFGGCCLRRADALMLSAILGSEALTHQVLGERQHWLVEADGFERSLAAISEIIALRVLAREDLMAANSQDGLYQPRDH